MTGERHLLTDNTPAAFPRFTIPGMPSDNYTVALERAAEQRFAFGGSVPEDQAHTRHRGSSSAAAAAGRLGHRGILGEDAGRGAHGGRGAGARHLPRASGPGQRSSDDRSRGRGRALDAAVRDPGRGLHRHPRTAGRLRRPASLRPRRGVVPRRHVLSTSVLRQKFVGKIVPDFRESRPQSWSRRTASDSRSILRSTPGWRP